MIRTESIELRFQGPVTKQAKAIRLMARLDFHQPVGSETGQSLVPWRDAFPKMARAVENGIILRETRKLLNLSQQQLSEFTGLSRRRISELETGKRLMSQAEAHRFATVLNVDYQVFL